MCHLVHQGVIEAQRKEEQQAINILPVVAPGSWLMLSDTLDHLWLVLSITGVDQHHDTSAYFG